jgi:hypothetical protein
MTPTKETKAIPVAPITVTHFSGRTMLMEDHGRRRIVLCASGRGHLETCGPEGVLVRCDTMAGAEVLMALAERFNAQPKLVATLTEILTIAEEVEDEDKEAALSRIRTIVRAQLEAA